MNILELNETIRSCTDCPLHRERTHAVPGFGDISSDIMLIGEGPGYHEDKAGEPFVGPSGQFLDELLLSIGLTRHMVFLANMLKCRAPKNRDPEPHELSSCSKYLDIQIAMINPKLIVTLGKFSTAKFIRFRKISDVRGKVVEVNGRYIFPIIHPAAALHNSIYKDPIQKDFGKIPEILKLPMPKPPGQIKEEPKQLSLL